MPCESGTCGYEGEYLALGVMDLLALEEVDLDCEIEFETQRCPRAQS